MRLIDADVLKRHIDKLPALPDGNFAGNHSALKALINMQPTIEPSANCSEIPNGSDDTISRQAAIDALYDWSNHTITDAEAWHLRQVIGYIKSMPSAQPEPHWIPCSEGLPEEREWIGTKTFGTTISDEVYVTFESPKGERFTKHLSFQNGKVSSFTQREIDVFYKGAVPIAWMPLPEPYKGGDTE